MRTNVAWGSAIGLMWLVCTGCSTQQSLIRGQSPSGPSGIQQAFAEMPAAQRAPIQQINYMPGHHGGYHAAQCPPSHCPPGHGHCHGYCMHGVLAHLCSACACLHSWPWHHTTQSVSDDYNDPHAFVYPPPYQPPAVVQYPYYTLRGPTDFFMP